MENFKLISVWEEETSKWHYFLDESKFVPENFENGYVDYGVVVVEGVIVEDSFSAANIGKRFTECYSEYEKMLSEQ